MAGEPSTAKADALLGQTLDGRFRIDAVLGEGGMGMVFKALQTSISRPVAVKTLHPQLATAPTFFDRFKREAEIASRLHHPNIITIFDFGRSAEGVCYYVMEYLEGESLRQRVKREGPLSIRQAIAVVEQIALGVAHAHKQGVIHRDLKPHNIMLTPVDGHEYVKVLDFGLVKAMEQTEDDENLTSTGQVLGTPQYMPPEQAGGEVVDARSDLYALTAVFFFCLTGNSPFGANTVRKALQAALKGEVQPVAAHRLGAPVPEAIDRFIKKGLSLEKDDRHQTAEAFVEAMKATVASASDAVLDALPTPKQPGTSKEPGSGSSASRKQATPHGKSVGVSQVSRPLPKKGSSAGPLIKDEQLASVRPTDAGDGPPGAKKRSLVPMALIGLAVLAVAGVAVLAARSNGGNAKPPPLEKPSTIPGPESQPSMQPRVEVPAVVAAKVSFETQPLSAEVLEAGVLIGNTPLTLDWPKGAQRTLQFKAPGFKVIEKSLKLEADAHFEFALEPLAPKPTGAKPPKVVKPTEPEVPAFE